MELWETEGFPSRKLNKFSQHQAFAEKIAQRAVTIFAVIAVAVLFVLLVHSAGLLDESKLRGFITKTGVWGPLVLVLFVTVGTLTFALPAIPAAILSGALYGPVLGAIYAYAGLLLSASIAFFISRSFRAPVLQILGSHAEIFLRFQERSVAAVVLVARMVPFFSFEAVSYASGLTSVSFTHYLTATAVGVLLPLLVFSAGGSALLTTESVFAPIFTAVVMIILFFVVPLAIDHYNPWGLRDKLIGATQKKSK